MIDIKAEKIQIDGDEFIKVITDHVKGNIYDITAELLGIIKELNRGFQAAGVEGASLQFEFMVKMLAFVPFTDEPIISSVEHVREMLETTFTERG